MAPSNSGDICPTGLPGLDTVLNGGLPSRRVYLISGDPGAGKTTLSLQFLIEGVRRKEKGLYITLSETRDELLQVAKSHGWDLSGIEIFELATIEEQIRGDLENTFFHPSDVELTRVIKALREEIQRINPKRVVFDSLSELRMMAESPLRFRRQMLSLKQFLASLDCTVLCLDDRTGKPADLQIDSIAHGVIELNKTHPEYGVARRTLLVNKLRGLKFREGNHDFTITSGGLVIFPRLMAGKHPAHKETSRFESHISGLDALLGGGLDRGTSSIFLGPPGTGKSTLTIKYACVAASQGEKVHYFVFDETMGTLFARSTALGIHLQEHMDAGILNIEVVDPAEITPGELCHRIREGVENQGIRMVIIDSLNGYLNAIPETKYLTLQLHELLAYLNQKGVVTLLVLAQQGLIGHMQSVIDLTYLADTVILHRFYEDCGEVKKAISVIKKRSGLHERHIREFSVDKDGIHVGEPLRQFRGVLTGTPELQEKSAR